MAGRAVIRRRRIGPAGTAARLALGLGLFGSVVHGHVAGHFRPAPWLLGLIGFPTLVVVWQSWLSRRTATRIQITGPVAHVANVAVFFALYLTPDYVPALSITSDAALVFYGTSMLLAAVRGYAGCEVLAISNWVLGRDDQVGCLVFAPVDHVEQIAQGSGECNTPPDSGVSNGASESDIHQHDPDPADLRHRQGPAVLR